MVFGLKVWGVFLGLEVRACLDGRMREREEEEEQDMVGTLEVVGNSAAKQKEEVLKRERLVTEIDASNPMRLFTLLLCSKLQRARVSATATAEQRGRPDSEDKEVLVSNDVVSS